MVGELNEVRDHWEVVVEKLQEELMAEFEGNEKPSTLADSENAPHQSDELDAARASANKSRLELEKLWKAANSVIKDPQTLADMTLRHAQAEAELEKQRLADTWDMIRDSVDMKAMVLLTRKATGCDGERTLSVGAARRVFERSASVEKPSLRDCSRGPTPPRRQAVGAPSQSRGAPKLMDPPSQARSARLRWNSRGPNGWSSGALESELMERAKNARQPLCRSNGLLPPRPKAQACTAEVQDDHAAAGGA